jgi:hypothetical protein
MKIFDTAYETIHSILHHEGVRHQFVDPDVVNAKRIGIVLCTQITAAQAGVRSCCPLSGIPNIYLLEYAI